MSRKLKILIIGSAPGSFVQDDIDIFSKIGQVKTIYSNGFGKDIGKTIWIIFRSICETVRCQVIVTWFADYHSALPAIIAQILRKPFIAIAGGFDVIAMPEIDWGAWIHWRRRLAVKLTFRLATEIWCQSNFTQRELKKRDKRLKPRVIYFGIEPASLEARTTSIKNPQGVLTIGLVYSERRYLVKGFDRWLELAQRNPRYHFQWVGFSEWMHSKIESLPPNCQLEPPLKMTELIPFYQEASIYCQPSRMETFGRSLLEAMLLGCIPIISLETALPEIAGPVGVVVSSDDWENINLDDINKNYHLPPAQIRERATLNFNLLKREEQIVQRMKEILHARQ
jgi:hypothetical protein